MPIGAAKSRKRPPEEEKNSRSYRIIRDTLKREIIIGLVEPGTAMPEVRLARRFQSSRAPVREALIHLQKDGFLTAADYRGFRVPEFSLQELKELFQTRLLLEPPAAEMAAGNPSLLMERISRLESCVALQEPNAGVSFDINRQLEAEILFHTLIAETSGNHLLASMVRQVRSDSSVITFGC